MSKINKLDKRMFLARNFHEIENDKEGLTEHDIEVFGESNFVGHWENDIYKFQIWEVGHRLPEGTPKRLLFSWKERQPKGSDRFLQSKDAFHHGGGIPEEFIYCISLVLRRRFKLGDFERVNGKPSMANTERKWINKSIVQGQTNLELIGSWLDLIIKLPEKLHQSVMLALKFYWQAISIIEDSPDLAYLTLISSIEILCSDYEIEKPTVSILNSDLGKLLDKVSDNDLKEKISDAIIKRENFISRKFCAFIIDHLRHEFWERPERPEHWRIEPAELPELIKRIYNQRSKTLHEGAQFPWSAFFPASRGELVGKLGVGSGQKEWSPREVIPTVGFFEVLVNHVIKNYIKDNSVQKELID